MSNSFGIVHPLTWARLSAMVLIMMLSMDAWVLLARDALGGKHGTICRLMRVLCLNKV